MTHTQFSHSPEVVPLVKTTYRCICTPIPNPDTLHLLEELVKVESRSMHGQLPVVWDRAENFQVWDVSGNCWIDFTSTIFVANAGHSNRDIIKALTDLLERPLLHSYTYATEVRVTFLKRLIEYVSHGTEKAFLLSSGTEATECALKLARIHGTKIGKRRNGIISYEESMHGRTMGAQLLGGTDSSREWVGFADPEIHLLDFPYPWNPEYQRLGGVNFFRAQIKDLERKGVNISTDIVAFCIESYVGWGALFYPQDYIDELAEYAKKNDILLIFDDIQGGFGRTGKNFAFEHYGVIPDIICLGKGISSSLPLSAVIGRAEIMDLPDIGSMSSTHSANPLVCAAGLANIDYICKHNLVSESARKGEVLFKRLRRMKERFPLNISEIYGNGLLAAVLFKDPRTGKADSERPTRICELAMKKGLLLVHTGRESIKIGPPLTIPDDALLEGLTVFEESIEDVLSEAEQ